MTTLSTLRIAYKNIQTIDKLSQRYSTALLQMWQQNENENLEIAYWVETSHQLASEGWRIIWQYSWRCLITWSKTFSAMRRFSSFSQTKVNPALQREEIQLELNWMIFRLYGLSYWLFKNLSCIFHKPQHTYMHTCMHACMHACIHTYIHTYMYEIVTRILRPAKVHHARRINN